MMVFAPDTFPVPDRLTFPIESYSVEGYPFGARVRSRFILWARHLGDDILADPGTPVVSIGQGHVVWSEIRPGAEKKRNWGGVVIVGHMNKHDQTPFFSVYGHMKDLTVKVGDTVQAGTTLGVVAAGLTPENGWWKLPHLHFGIYVGPWTNQVLAGYARPFEGRTRFRWWKSPQAFIDTYNTSVSKDAA